MGRGRRRRRCWLGRRGHGGGRHGGGRHGGGRHGFRRQRSGRHGSGRWDRRPGDGHADGRAGRRRGLRTRRDLRGREGVGRGSSRERSGSGEGRRDRRGRRVRDRRRPSRDRRRRSRGRRHGRRRLGSGGRPERRERARGLRRWHRRRRSALHGGGSLGLFFAEQVGGRIGIERLGVVELGLRRLLRRRRFGWRRRRPPNHRRHSARGRSLDDEWSRGRRDQLLELDRAVRQLGRARIVSGSACRFGGTTDPDERLLALASTPKGRGSLKPPDDVFDVLRLRLGQERLLIPHEGRQTPITANPPHRNPWCGRNGCSSRRRAIGPVDAGPLSGASDRSRRPRSRSRTGFSCRTHPTGARFRPRFRRRSRRGPRSSEPPGLEPRSRRPSTAPRQACGVPSTRSGSARRTARPLGGRTRATG